MRRPARSRLFGEVAPTAKSTAPLAGAGLALPGAERSADPQSAPEAASLTSLFGHLTDGAAPADEQAPGPVEGPTTLAQIMKETHQRLRDLIGNMRA